MDVEVMAASSDWVCTKNHMPKKSIKKDSAFRTRTFSSEPVAERNQCGLLWTALLFLGTAFSFRSSGDLELDEAFATPGGFSPCRMFRVDLPISWSYYRDKRKNGSTTTHKSLIQSRRHSTYFSLKHSMNILIFPDNLID